MFGVALHIDLGNVLLLLYDEMKEFEHTSH